MAGPENSGQRSCRLSRARPGKNWQQSITGGRKGQTNWPVCAAGAPRSATLPQTGTSPAAIRACPGPERVYTCMLRLPPIAMTIELADQQDGRRHEGARWDPRAYSFAKPARVASSDTSHNSRRERANHGVIQLFDVKVFPRQSNGNMVARTFWSIKSENSDTWADLHRWFYQDSTRAI